MFLYICIDLGDDRTPIDTSLVNTTDGFSLLNFAFTNPTYISASIGGFIIVILTIIMIPVLIWLLERKKRKYTTMTPDTYSSHTSSYSSGDISYMGSYISYTDSYTSSISRDEPYVTKNKPTEDEESDITNEEESDITNEEKSDKTNEVKSDKNKDESGMEPYITGDKLGEDSQITKEESGKKAYITGDIFREESQITHEETRKEPYITGDKFREEAQITKDKSGREPYITEDKFKEESQIAKDESGKEPYITGEISKHGIKVSTTCAVSVDDSNIYKLESRNEPNAIGGKSKYTSRSAFSMTLDKAVDESKSNPSNVTGDKSNEDSAKDVFEEASSIFIS